ncbi:MAG: phosphatidylserine decarboxylase [Proteobacteria bacterium]|nr:phosphatidylserine decarboxylase [Pseudomonadota bacterium]
MSEPVELTKTETAKILLFGALPHHLISRVVYYITRLRGPMVHPMINYYIKKFDVDMTEAAYENTGVYATFNEFFTRPLKQKARPVDQTKNTLSCPADGTISEAGSIQQRQIFQAKGHFYTTTELLGGDTSMSALFENGRFATIYLAPKNYHRVHMPTHGLLKKMIHVPGRLFSVAPWTVGTIPGLFTGNERVACLFATEAGPIAMVLVGAINVAAIETVWAGLVTPPKGKKISDFDYSHTRKIYARGDEMGRFNMGSTVILLAAKNVEWLEKIRAGQAVKMGEIIAKFRPRKKSG